MELVERATKEGIQNTSHSGGSSKAEAADHVDEEDENSSEIIPDGQIPRLSDSQGNLTDEAKSAKGDFAGASQPSHAAKQGNSMAEWVEKLGNGTAKQREDAATALAKIKPKDVNHDVVSALSRALLDADDDVVKLSAYALGRIGEKGVPALTTGLQLEDEETREACAVGLVEAGRSAAEPLVKLLSRVNRNTSSTASAILGRIGAPAVPELIKALDDDRVQVRGLALLSLGKMDKEGRNAAPHVRKLLDDSHSGVRAIAADVLEKISP